MSVYDVIERSDKSYIYYNGEINNKKYYVASSTNENGNNCSISIDNEEYSLNQNGYNFVVYDSKTYNVVDSVVFQNENYYYVEDTIAS